MIDMAQQDWLAAEKPPPLERARAQARSGIKRARDHANRTQEGWSDRAYALLEEYVRERCVPFLAEQFVLFAAGRIPPPPDGRAWGHPIQRGARQGLIRRVGFAPAETSHGSPKALWRAVGAIDDE